MTPLLSEADAGVKVTRPATSRNASELPTVPTGTFSVTFTAALPPAGTLIDEIAPPTMPLLVIASVCGEPAWFATAMLNVAADAPLLSSRIVRVFE